MRNGNWKSTGVLFDIVNHFFLLLFLIVCMYPFYYIFIYSLSDPIEAQRGITLIPVGFSLDNYFRILFLKGMLNAAVISTLRAVIGTGLTIFCCTFFAYLLTKNQMLFRKIVYRFLIITMYFNSGLIPWYLTMKALHLNNNFLLYIIPYAVSAYYVILLKTFIEQMPAALEESAEIDGAGYFTIFIKIIFPLSIPIVATIAVFSAVTQWNTWIDNFLLVENPNLLTLQLILYNYINEASRLASLSASDFNRAMVLRKITPEAVRMTITMVVTIPILFVYPFMQKYFVKGIMLGAVKG